MKTIKTVLSLLLMLCMLCSLATAAFADSDGGDSSLPPPGSVSNPATPVADGQTPAAPATDTAALTSGGDAQTPAPTLNAGVSVTADAVSGTSVEVDGIDIAIVPDQANWVPDQNGVNIEYNSGDQPIVDIGGSIAASDSYGPGLLVANNSANVTVNVGNKDTVGNVTNSDGDGITAYFSGDSSSLTVWGDVEGNGSEMGSGITVMSVSGESKIDVKGDVSGGSAAGSASAGITVLDYGAELTVTTITVGGDVNGSKLGGGINVSYSYEGDTKIIVGSVDSDGTVTGGTVTGGIQLNDGVTPGNTSITAWKVNGGITGAEETVIQEVIHYLVGLVQPESGSISADMTTANEGDTVHLTVDMTPKAGYEIKAYNGEGSSRQPLKKDSNGFFYYDVTRGGGILLSAVLEKIKPAPAATDLSFSAVKFTFNLDGGTLDGETGKVVKWFVPGATVKLPAAPTKDGFTFAGWQTKVGDEVKVFQAGEKFTVTAAQDFTALWE